eukprot:TRINITY_DN14228_c0_g1_i1.p1 TRINITY_DN14228_c0_g1~~TRINITY_DN14228_c0_g1_i1.p1  ORF type:complete len:228 (-),score=50.18 TRINITY_DN14228_c0_g1_i1:50-697(-)
MEPKQPKILVVFMLRDVLIDRIFVKDPGNNRKHNDVKRFPIADYRHLREDFTSECHKHRYRVFVRPYYVELIQFLRQNNFGIAIWSDEKKANMENILEKIFPHPQRLILKWGVKELDVKKSNKKRMDLDKLWKNKRVVEDGYDQSNTFVIASARKKDMVVQKENLLVVDNYCALNKSRDVELKELRLKLEKILDEHQQNQSKDKPHSQLEPKKAI